MKRMKAVSKLLLLGMVIGAVLELSRTPAADAVVRARTIEDVIFDGARKHGNPAIVSRCLALIESGGNPEAVNINRTGGWSNADVGLYQLNVRTLKGYGVKPSDALSNVELNADLGNRHLRQQFEWATGATKYERWLKALAAYNAGQGNWKVGLPHAHKVLGCVQKELAELNL